MSVRPPKSNSRPHNKTCVPGPSNYGRTVVAGYMGTEPVRGVLRPAHNRLRRQYGQSVVVVETTNGQQRIFRTEKLMRPGATCVFAD